MLAGGSAICAGAWVTPSVLTLDRVSAAVGSCGTAPVQVDWSAYTNTMPNSVTANDGTVVTITRSDPFGVADPGFFGSVFGGTLSLADNPMLMAMSNANNGEFTEIVFSFSTPVQLCFDFVDVDRGLGSWEDTMIITGTNGGTAVGLNAGDFVTGPANTFVATNEVVGTASSANSQTNGNVTVNYPAAVDVVRIRHRDDTTWTGFQFIGIHDLRWC